MIELLAVVGTISILALLLLPALAGIRPDSQSFQCRNNLRQVILAWTMYADDFNDTLALNPDQSVPVGTGLNPTPPWAGGKVDWSVHGLGDPNTNILYLTDPKGSSLANYYGHNPNLFRCPTDNYVSNPQRAAGYTHRLRSITMNGAVGGGNPNPSQLGYKPPAALVTLLTPSYFYAVKRSQLTVPGPAQSWVLMDENPDSIDDAIVYTDPAATNGLGIFTELPSSGHSGGAGVAFADGHVDIHRWTDARTFHAVRYNNGAQRVVISGTPSADLAWLAVHTPIAR